MRTWFSRLAYESADDLIFGSAPRAVKLGNGIIIGGGRVFPEINFTLPAMEVNENTMPEVLSQYREMVSGILRRSCELSVPSLVLEVELLPPMTNNPVWGVDVVKVVKDVMTGFETREGLAVGLRVTPNDIREFVRPTEMRRGRYLNAMLQTFAGVAAAGADSVVDRVDGWKGTARPRIDSRRYQGRHLRLVCHGRQGHGVPVESHYSHS